VINEFLFRSSAFCVRLPFNQGPGVERHDVWLEAFLQELEDLPRKSLASNIFSKDDHVEVQHAVQIYAADVSDF
jgi:hypothetical protein